MTNLRDDLRTAVRSLARRPGFAAVVVLTLAIALGANTAVFSVLQQTVLRPLPYSAAQDAAYLTREIPQGGLETSPVLDQVRFWRERARTIAALESFNDDRVVLRWQGKPRELTAAWVTPGLFGFLGVSPVLGDGFDDGSDGGSDREVILSHALWRELFGGDPGALGESLRLGEDRYTVVGVMAPGVGPAAVEEELLALERHRVAEQEGGNEATVWTPRVRDLGYQFAGDLARRVVFLQAAVALMLLIACANVGNLFLIRAEGRSREIGVRAALGAGRWRVARPLLMESLLLAGGGALLGLLVARWGGGLVARQGGLLIGTGLLLGLGVSLALGRFVESHLYGVTARDPTVVIATIVVLAAATAVATLVPARRASRLDPARVLRAE